MSELDEIEMPVHPRTGMTWTWRVMSNLHHTIDDGLDADLRAGKRAWHYAWNFNGQVWFDGAQFAEEVWVRHVLAAERRAASLEELMRIVSDEFGWD